MSVEIIVAMDQNRVIGNKNKIPWNIQEDLALFKKRTLGYPVIMGANTWDSLPRSVKPLPGRLNVIISKKYFENNSLRHDQINVFEDLKAAIEKLKTQFEKLFIIGGAKVYKSALDLDLVDRIVVSHVVGEHEGDAFFPELNNSWKPLENQFYSGFNVIEYIKAN